MMKTFRLRNLGKSNKNTEKAAIPRKHIETKKQQNTRKIQKLRYPDEKLGKLTVGNLLLV